MVNAQWLLYVPSCLTLKNSTFCPHSVFTFCMELTTNSDYFPIRHRLVFITEMECVYYAVRTGPLHNTDCVSSLRRLIAIKSGEKEIRKHIKSARM